MIHPSRRSCSGAVATISSMKAAGITTAPSSSVTIQSSGKIATPPQPIGSPQPTKVRPATEGGAAAPWHHTGNPVARTPATSRITPSVTSAATPFLRMRESAATTSWSLPIAASVAGERAILRVRRLALEVDLAQQRRELRVVHGLHQVMIEAGRAGAPHILVLAPAGHRNERHGGAPRLGADRARRVVAIEPRHADVEERYVGLELAAEREALHAVG